MSRRIRNTLLVVLLSVAFGTTACASATAPRGDEPCQSQGGGYSPC